MVEIKAWLDQVHLKMNESKTKFIYHFDSVSGIAIVRDSTVWTSAMGCTISIDGSSGCPIRNHLDGVIYD